MLPGHDSVGTIQDLYYYVNTERAKKTTGNRIAVHCGRGNLSTEKANRQSETGSLVLRRLTAATAFDADEWSVFSRIDMRAYES